MIEHQPVAAIAPVDRIFIDLAAPNVFHTIAHAQDCAIGSG